MAKAASLMDIVDVANNPEALRAISAIMALRSDLTTWSYVAPLPHNHGCSIVFRAENNTYHYFNIFADGTFVPAGTGR